MYILGIETSCDETSAAVISGANGRVELLSNVVSSSVEIHQKTGGIIPENAAREQIKYILPVIQKALSQAKIPLEKIDAIGLTYGPGLIGSLLVGVETVKTLSYILKKPIIPINHMLGHIYANFISGNPKSEIRNPNLIPSSYNLVSDIKFPAIALVVSGGHTDLLLMTEHGKFKLLGGTRDDAAGEAFDKIGRLLNLTYPAGPDIERLAKKGIPKRFNFPRPLLGSIDFDFSFSGLKTAVLREVQSIKNLDSQTINNLCYAAQDAIIDVLVNKTIKALQKHNSKSILISGGVAANQKLREKFYMKIENLQLEVNLFAPPKNLCTDNAAMIATAAYFTKDSKSWKNITANPELYYNHLDI